MIIKFIKQHYLCKHDFCWPMGTNDKDLKNNKIEVICYKCCLKGIYYESGWIMTEIGKDYFLI